MEAIGKSAILAVMAFLGFIFNVVFRHFATRYAGTSYVFGRDDQGKEFPTTLKREKQGDAEVKQPFKPMPLPVKRGKEIAPSPREEISTSSPKLNPKRKRDLEFYKLILGNQCTWSKTIQRVMENKGFQAESRLLCKINEIRYACTVKTRAILREHFSDDDDEGGLELKNMNLNSKFRSAKGLNTIMSEALSTHESVRRKFPLPIYDAIETEILLHVGDALFPDYESVISELNDVIDYIENRFPANVLHGLLYEVLWETNPEVVATLYSLPRQPEKYLKHGTLTAVPISHRRRRRRRKNNIHVSRSCFSSSDPSIMEWRIQVLRDEVAAKSNASDINSDMYEGGMHFIFIRAGMEEENSSLAQAIILEDAHVVPLEDDDELKGRLDDDYLSHNCFFIKGKSPTKKGKINEYVLAAEDEKDRNDWIHCLTKLQRKKENAVDHLEEIFMWFFKCIRIWQTDQDFERVRNLRKEMGELTLNVAEASNMGSFRHSLVAGMSKVLAYAAGNKWCENSWKKHVFCVQLMLQDYREACLFQRDVKKNENSLVCIIRKGRRHHHHSCAVM
eukprot:jgi/Bigna1/84089/fgenesh1_pg.122_\